MKLRQNIPVFSHYPPEVTCLHMGTLVYIIPSINCTYRIQMKEVVRIANMVPNGMDLWASLRSPDLLDPAIIPEIKHKHTHAHTGVC